jgi:hypothetical protein
VRRVREREGERETSQASFTACDLMVRVRDGVKSRIRVRVRVTVRAIVRNRFRVRRDLTYSIL